ncbi:MAG TPA: DNA-binding protein [Candidatus Wallbacteria bacterium]|nr:DNA-binding protein [Candidatus Wallbacteria bacterium]
MKYKWLEEYCLSKKGAVKEYKPEWEAFLYRVGGKMFAMAGEDGGKKPIISLKCEPMTAQLLRSQYSDVVPGYYMNKEHWNSVYLEGAVPAEALKQMIDMSYDLVLNSLTKKMIKQIQEA